MGGRFRLRNGEIAFDPLMFSVEGATVRLTGGYHLAEESIDFRGNLLLHARLSETVGGWKSWVAKPFDPLFRRDGKTVLPIKVTGRRDEPGVRPRRQARAAAGPVSLADLATPFAPVERTALAGLLHSAARMAGEGDPRTS
jgi:hypothetical protein